MTVSNRLAELRAVRKLGGVVVELESSFKTIAAVVARGEAYEAAAVCDAVERLSSVIADYTKALAAGTQAAKEFAIEPKHTNLTDWYKAVTGDLEATLQEAAKAKLDPYLLPALFELLQAILGLIWGAGAAKSRHIGDIAKTCFSAQGWSRLHQAQAHAAQLDAWKNHA